MQRGMTELNTALCCLASYFGVLQFQYSKHGIGSWAAAHYRRQGLLFTSERSELLRDLTPLVADARTASDDLADVIVSLEAQGRQQTFLRREIG